MIYTPFQRRALNWAGLAKVKYRNIWNKSHQLGYTSPNRPLDDITIAKDHPDKKVKEITLLHEVGHIYFDHVHINIKEELKYVQSLFKKLNRDYLLVMTFGGPMGFLNVAMDLEVNSKLLTLGNVKYMKDHDLTLCTPESMKVPALDSFRDYYEPLILNLPEGKVEMDGTISIQMSGEGGEGQQGQGGTGKGKSGKGKGKSGKGSSSTVKDVEKQNKEGGAGDPTTQDISQGVSVFDEDFDEELSNALAKEGYQSGEDKDQSNDGNGNGGDDTTVDDAAENGDGSGDGEDGGNSSSRGGHGAGDGHSKGDSTKVVENSSKEIKSFISQIIDSSMVYQPDSMRHYIRGTRKNPGNFLYTSIRRRALQDKKRLGILVDVSGSMYVDSVMTAIRSMKESLNVVSSDSVLVTWDTSKCEEFPITKIPESVSLGGGTDMAKGLKYLVNEKKCDEVVVYSDMGTEIPSMTSLIKSKGTKVYTIKVCESSEMQNGKFTTLSWGDPKEWAEYVKVNKKVLYVTNDQLKR